MEKGRNSLGYHLHRAFAALTGALTAELAARGIRLNHQQFSIIRAVNRAPGMSQARLARETGMDAASISRSVSTLERRGLLRRDEINGCTKGLYLTDGSAKLLPLLEAAISAATEKCGANVNEDDMKICLTVIRKIAANGERNKS